MNTCQSYHRIYEHDTRHELNFTILYIHYFPSLLAVSKYLGLVRLDTEDEWPNKNGHTFKNPRSINRTQTVHPNLAEHFPEILSTTRQTFAL